MGMSKVMTLKPNTIRDRGLPEIFSQHRWWREVWPMFQEIGVEEVYRGAHAEALDTIEWFIYGKHPLAFPNITVYKSGRIG
jgi:hypothetical protein